MGTSEASPDPQAPVNPTSPLTPDPTSTGVSTGDAPSTTSETTTSTPVDSSAGPDSTETSSQPGVPPGVDPAVQVANAAAQSTDDVSVVPEQRPQTFVQPDPSTASAASVRAAESAAPAATQEDYDRANSDEAKAEAEAAGRLPNLLVGQRVQVTGDHPEAGRMAHIIAIEYIDGINALLGTSATPEARFAEVADYIVRTRDGRSDLLVLTPSQASPLDDIQGWGRGQI